MQGPAQVFNTTTSILITRFDLQRYVSLLTLFRVSVEKALSYIFLP